MKPETTEDIIELMDGSLISAALGAAMELGIFRLLARNSLPEAAVAESLDIPLNLPTGFGMVMLWDVGVFDKTLFRKIYEILNPAGHPVIVDKFSPGLTDAPPSRLLSAFLDSLQHPSQFIDFTTAQDIQTQLEQAGFRNISITPVQPKDHLPWNLDWPMMAAWKETDAV